MGLDVGLNYRDVNNWTAPGIHVDFPKYFPVYLHLLHGSYEVVIPPVHLVTKNVTIRVTTIETSHRYLAVHVLARD